MSMHLVGPYLTTTNYKKRKIKVTQRQHEAWQLEWMERNRQLKRQGQAKISFEQFVDEKHGIVPRVKAQTKSVLNPSKPYRRETPYYPSLNSGLGQATLKEKPMYTGDAMIGIGVLHKSNSVPIFKKQDAEDISKMRRG